MAKSKAVVIEIDDPLFKTAIVIQVGGTVNECIARYAKRIGVAPWELDESAGRYAHFAAYMPKKNGCIWLSEFNTAYLAHEAVHAAHYLLGQSGMTLTDSSEEAYSYFVEWIVRETSERYARKRARS